MKKINEQIAWYDENATRKDDDIIKANLKLIKNLYSEIEFSDDAIYFEKIIGTFCEIMEIQRNLINELSLEVCQDVPVFEADNAYPPEFTCDRELQDYFTSYCIETGKSSYTVNDYCSRIKNLWKSFCAEQQSAEREVSDNPLLSAYLHTDELSCYINMKIAESVDNRNRANTRSALNKLCDFKSEIQK